MNDSRLIVTVGLALSLFAVPAFAATGVSERMEAAYRASLAVQEAYQEDGSEALAGMRQVLEEADAHLAEAERMVQGEERLVPGIRTVRANIRTILDQGGVKDPTLVDENVIKMHALTINSELLAATDRLDQAVSAVEKGRFDHALSIIDEADQILASAMRRGGYHVTNDRDEIELARVLLSDSGDAAAGAARDNLVERIAEVRDHMFELGTVSR
ncbi:MAG: hypothetical protein ACE5FN_11185 [Leptospirillia bacterium]